MGGENIIDGNIAWEQERASVVFFHKISERLSKTVECWSEGGEIFHLVYPDMGS